MKIISAVKNNYGKYLARGVGAVAVGLVARDSHLYGKIQADMRMKTKNADASQYYLYNTLGVDKLSKTKVDLQNKVFGFEMDNGFRGFFNAGVGYFQGLFNGLVQDVVPLVLGTTALFAKNKHVVKGSGIALAAYAAVSVVKDGLGLGKTNPAKLPNPTP